MPRSFPSYLRARAAKTRPRLIVAFVLLAAASLFAFGPALPSGAQFLSLTRRADAATDLSVPRAAGDRRTTESRHASPRLLEAYGKLPLRFEPNRGQTSREVKYLSRGGGYTLFLTPTEAVLRLRIAEPEADGEMGRRGDGEKGRWGDGEKEATSSNVSPSPHLPFSPSQKSAVLRVSLVGANRKPEMRGEEELPGKSNYFNGNDPKKWRAGVEGFGRVRYTSVYPGTDLVYYGSGGRLEYDFHLAPGADPRRIRLRFEGARSVRLDEQGDLVINAEGGDVRQHKPVIYQEVGGERKEIEGRYVLLANDSARRRAPAHGPRPTAPSPAPVLVGFEVGEYDRARPLVIDPVLVYSTYLGGSDVDQGLAVAVDAQGSAYVTGLTASLDFPGPSPVQNANGGFSDAFVLKLNPAGTGIVYATYLGGNGDDLGNAVAVDAQGNAYVAGLTGSGSFPRTQGAWQTSKDGALDAYLTKLDPSGSSLLYSTFIGGNNSEQVYGVAVDSAGRATVVGRTDSTHFTMFPPETRKGDPVLKSTNGAGSWGESDAGLRASAVNAFATDPSNPNLIYAGSSSGVYKSTDGGASWLLTGTLSLATSPFFTNALAVDPSNPSIIYAGTSNGVFKSTDGGNTYAVKNGGFTIPVINALAVNSSTPTTVYAGTVFGIFKSTNGGDNWVAANNGIPLSPPRVTRMVIDPSNPSIVYAGTNRGVFKTTDGGANWAAAGNLPQITALAIDPSNTSTLYAGALLFPSLIFKSTNGGATWTASGNGLSYMVSGQSITPVVNALVVDPSAPSTVYAGTTGGGVFKTTDGAANWSASNTGLTNRVINALALAVNDPATLYAGAFVGNDAFVARFNAAGSHPEYVRFLGGFENDEARGLALDAAGNAYVVGTTNSADFPTMGAFQPAQSGLSDAFVLKLDAATAALVYSTYLGGSVSEQGRGIAVNTVGNAFVTGSTFSNDFPVASALQPTNSAGDSDGFVTKLAADGASLVYSTYFGGTATDQGNAITVDAAGNAYVAGLTLSGDDFPVVAAPQPTYGGGNDGFVSKINAAGTSLLYSTYLGGGNTETVNSIAVDAAGNAYVVGNTASTNFPTANPLKATLGGPSDAFVAKLGIDANLSITKTDSRDPVMVNNPLAYTLAVSNTGSDAASNVRVSDTLPAGVTLASATPTQGTCGGTATVVCDLGEIAANGSASVQIVVTPSSTGTVSNTASVTSDTPDLNTSNNSATQETRVSALPSIAGRVTDGSGNGVGGVLVSLGGSQTATAQTDGQGRYQFADLTQGGNYTVTPARQGFVFNPQSRSFANLTADATADFGAVSCVFNITPLNQSFPAGGGVGAVTVNAPDAQCPWTATSNAPWINITSGAVGVGTGTVTFSVAPTNNSRSGTLTIAGNVFTVWQELSPCATPSFTTAPRFPAGPSPAFTAQGDFNNDGKADVAVLNHVVSNVTQTPKVSILIGTGAGGFEAPRTVDLVGGPRDLALADFNNDGKLDVAALGGNVQIYLGDGAGNLGQPAAFNAGGQPSSIAVGDFNKDGKADLAVSNEDSHNVSILLGTGTGAFGPASQIGGNPILHAARRVRIGDFNKDGNQDLFVVGSFMWLIQGNGDGTFATPAQLNSTLLGAVVVGDFNKDGKDDLAGWNGNFGVNVLLGDGAGGFAAPITSQTGGRQPGRLVVADFNGDGNPDLGAANNSFQGTRDVNALLGDGAGSFTPGPAYLTGVGVTDIAVADFDGDGRQDIVAADSTGFSSSPVGQVALLVGTGAGSFVGSRSFVAPFNPQEIAADDFNGDGRQDLIVSNGNGSVFGNLFIMPSSGAGEFGAPILISSDVRPQSFVVRDFNRDGKPDLGVLSLDSSGGVSRSRVQVLLGNGAGGFTQASDTPLETFNQSVVYGDFNGDGKLDLVSRNVSIRLTLRLGDGAGGFGPPSVVSPQLNPLTLETGDFNGDGKGDLVVNTGSSGCGFPLDSQLQILFGDGAGGFSAPSVMQFGGFVSYMTAQDLNGDGRSELVVINGCTKKFAVLFANAAGGFNAGAEFAAGDNPRRHSLADLSGDGKPDLIVSGGATSGDTSIISVLVGDGAGGFSAPTSFVAGLGITSFVAGDFDGNGRADIAFTDLPANHVGVLFNSCPVPASATLQFANASFNSAEGLHSVTITVTRTGDTSGEAFVNFATTDGTATERKDYTAAVGRLRFAPGETSKSFDILLTDDRFDDDGESFNVTLSNPVGATLGSQITSTVPIADNDASNGPSPVKDASIDVSFFVRQHYADFLNRVPDQAGLDFWVDRATNCGQQDLLVCRINVSAAFFLSIENQETGYLTHRAYKVAFSNLPGKPVPLTLREYLAGSRQIGDGVQVGVGNWQRQLEANKAAFFSEFVATTRFTALYPQGMNNGAFVDALNANAGGALSQAERDALVNALNASTMTRAQVLRAVAEDADFAQGAEKNRAFVLAQYFGYLRRNPDDVGFNGQPDPNFEGYNFWLGRLNQFGGNFIRAEMVKAFIQSIEYGERFGQ